MSPTKVTVRDFAILGADPLFSQPRHVGQPAFPHKQQILAKIGEAMDRRWVTNNGPLIQELEARLAAYLGGIEVVTVSNGTVALELLARALDLQGEVIVPGYTFVATAHALRWLGLSVVFCDVDPATHLIDPAKVEALITPRTSAIVGVHLWGEVCATEALTEICERHNLKLLFDAAHAFGCAHEGRMVGGLGDAETFSFHGTKFFNTFEGGAVTTRNGALAARLRLMRNFGFEGFDQVSALGVNARLSEVAAAAGLVNLEHLEETTATNKRRHAQYESNLAGLSGLRVYPLSKKDQRNHQYCVLEWNAGSTGISRDTVMRVLHAEGVLARRYFYPGVHRMEPYRTEDPNIRLPNTEALGDSVLVLPGSHAVSEEDVERISDLLRMILRFGPELQSALGEDAGPTISRRS